MSLLVFLADLPVQVLLVLIGCIFVFLLLLTVFVPSAAARISCVMDILLRPYYDRRRIELTIVLHKTPNELSRKEESE
jgi:hypothetical protein